MVPAFIKKAQVIFYYCLTCTLSCIVLGLLTLDSVHGEKCTLSVQCLQNYLCINGSCIHMNEIWKFDNENKRQYIGEILTTLVFIFLGLFACVSCAICIRNCFKCFSRPDDDVDDTRTLLEPIPHRRLRSRQRRSQRANIAADLPNYQSTSRYPNNDDYKNDPPPPYSAVVGVP